MLPCLLIAIVYVVDSLPLLLLLLMPLYGSLCGAAVVLKLSLLLQAHGVVNCFVPRILCFIGPLLNAILIGAVVVFSVISIPDVILVLYGGLLWMSEPVFLILEIQQTVKVGFRLTDKATNMIYENEGEYEYYIKAVILFIAAASYGTSFYLWRYSLMNASTSTASMLLLALIGFHVLLVIGTIIADSGVISNSSFICLLSAASAGVMAYESSIDEFTSKRVPGTIDFTEDKSLWDILIEMPNYSLASGQRMVDHFRNCFGPVFWLLLCYRLTCFVSAFGWIRPSLDPSKDNELYDKPWQDLAEPSDDDTWIPWREIQSNQLFKRVLFIAVYTRMVAGHSANASTVLPSAIAYARLAQGFLAPALYLHHLVVSETSTN